MLFGRVRGSDHSWLTLRGRRERWYCRLRLFARRACLVGNRNLAVGSGRSRSLGSSLDRNLSNCMNGSVDGSVGSRS